MCQENKIEKGFFKNLQICQTLTMSSISASLLALTRFDVAR